MSIMPYYKLIKYAIELYCKTLILCRTSEVGFHLSALKAEIKEDL